MISIATDLTEVKSKLDTIDGLVDLINAQRENLYKNIQSGSGLATIAVSNTFQTLLNITGEGYLYKAVGCNIEGITKTSKIKITVDGVVKVWTKNSGALKDSLTGLVVEEFTKPVSATYPIPPATLCPSATVGELKLYNLMIPNTLSYPQASEVAGCIIIPKPVYFSSSLLIEITTDDTVANHYQYSYSVATKQEGVI